MVSDNNKDQPSKPQLSLLIDMNTPHRVLEEVKLNFLEMFNNDAFTRLSAVFEDVVALF